MIQCCHLGRLCGGRGNEHHRVVEIATEARRGQDHRVVELWLHAGSLGLVVVAPDRGRGREGIGGRPDLRGRGGLGVGRARALGRRAGWGGGAHAPGIVAVVSRGDEGVKGGEERDSARKCNLALSVALLPRVGLGPSWGWDNGSNAAISPTSPADAHLCEPVQVERLSQDTI